MNQHRICIIGGTGFVGHSLAQKLDRAGHEVTILSHASARHRDLQVLPGVCVVQANVHDAESLFRHFRAKDVVINLAGILNSGHGRRRSFEAVHAELPRLVATVCVQTEVKRLLHMSALGASADGPSAYLRTKAAGEQAAHQAGDAGVAVTSFRPSVIFGPRDSFTNRFVGLLKMTPMLPLACPGSLMQPVYIEDVTDVMVQAMDDYRSFGRHYELCGPQVYRLDALVRTIARMARMSRIVLPLDPLTSRLMSIVGEILPGKPISRDNFRSLSCPSTCKENGFDAYGIRPHALEEVGPLWLDPMMRRGR